MTHKRIGYYPDTQAPASITGADQLLIEIGCNQVVLLVKGQLPKQLEAFEVFDIDTFRNRWEDELAGVKKASQLLGRSYSNIVVYYNLPDALVVPESKFTVEAGRDYLDQIYGDSSNDPAGYEELAMGSMVVTYRVKKAISEWVNHEFPSHKPSHIYSGMLNELLGRALPDANFIVIRFYTKHMVVAILKDRQLQLIQSFNYDTEEDILYYLLSLVQQFSLDPAISHAEVAGELDKRSATALQLPNLFGKVTWNESGDTGIFSKVLADHPVHYFTPYYKLGI